MAKVKTSKAKSKSFASSIWSTALTLIYAVLAALIVRTVAFEPFNIPSGSMVPSLLIGDYLFVSKYSYGYSKHSLPWSVPLFNGRIIESQPERGDVAVFKLPADGKTDYIKRIIGLPGDRIQVLKGVLHINGEPVIRRRIEDFSYTDQYGRSYKYPQYEETLPTGVSYRTLDSTPNGGLDNTQIYTVPEDHYFAMGDNRDRSQDSRVPLRINQVTGRKSGVGFIPAENLVGRAEFIFHSLENGAGIQEIWRWPSDTRGERVFKAIE